MAQSGIPVYADTTALSRLARNLRAAAPAAWRAYKISVRGAAQVALADMQSRASFSERIPQSGKVQVTAGGNVKIVFTAEDAAPIENSGKGFVRHPVHGHMDRWTSKNSHPAFAAPALEAHQDAMVAAIETAITNAVARTLGI